MVLEGEKNNINSDISNTSQSIPEREAGRELHLMGENETGSIENMVFKKGLEKIESTYKCIW